MGPTHDSARSSVGAPLFTRVDLLSFAVLAVGIGSRLLSHEIILSSPLTRSAHLSSTALSVGGHVRHRSPARLDDHPESTAPLPTSTAVKRCVRFRQCNPSITHLPTSPHYGEPTARFSRCILEYP